MPKFPFGNQKIEFKEPRQYIGSVYVSDPVFFQDVRGDTGRIWIWPGTHKVVREFDKDRLLIEVGDKLTLIKKSLTNWNT